MKSIPAKTMRVSVWLYHYDKSSNVIFLDRLISDKGEVLIPTATSVNWSWNNRCQIRYSRNRSEVVNGFVLDDSDETCRMITELNGSSEIGEDLKYSRDTEYVLLAREYRY